METLESYLDTIVQPTFEDFSRNAGAARLLGVTGGLPCHRSNVLSRSAMKPPPTPLAHPRPQPP
jgi:hypothetical protein